MKKENDSLSPFPQDFKIVVYNVENLFLSTDFSSLTTPLELLAEEDWQKMHCGLSPMRPLTKVLALAEHINRLSPDLLMMSEVGGELSLSNFNRYFLGNKYRPLIIEGNSDRGIDLAYLLRADLPLRCELKSHKDRPLNFFYKKDPSKMGNRFSRDVLELRLYPEGPPSPPLMIFLLVHLKSQLDKENLDPQGRLRRQAELQTVLQIYQELDSEFQQRVPLLIGGDFNGHAALPYPDREFTHLYEQTNLKDALEIAQVPPEKRITHMHFYPWGALQKSQLDYLFLPPALYSSVIPEGTRVDTFLPLPALPFSKEKLRDFPSDHHPLVVQLKF